MSAELTAQDGAALLALARAAIADRLFATGALAVARKGIELTPRLAALRACFVTLKTPDAGGALRLRGCIGTIEARLPARDAVVASALDAAFADPRFAPLTREEYPGLVLSVSMLTPIVPVPGADHIVPGRDGVALEAGGRSALFLPEVAAEHGWSRIELLDQLARKAGLPADAWRTGRLSTFQSERFGEQAT
jgi:AmmeMemoRadiSam system protein A